MSAVESSIVLFPRYTVLAGATGVFATPPLDVSRFGGAQLQVWWGDWALGSPSDMWIEESLDGVAWPADAATSFSMAGTNITRFLSVAFRLRWFRLRVVNRSNFLPLWCEGILRAGGSGAQLWARPTAASGGAAQELGARTDAASSAAPGRSMGGGGELRRRPDAGSIESLLG